MRRRAKKRGGVNETYLEAGSRGKNTWWRYVLGVVSAERSLPETSGGSRCGT
jgi:hypothetical protein